MPEEREDKAWQEIVENFGERAELDEPLPAAPPEPEPEPEPVVLQEGEYELGSWATGNPDADWTQDRFVPPPPPPIPHTTPDRLAAWIGLFGSPAVLLLCLIFSISLPQIVSYALIAGFIGGFGYLVFRMPAGPADPYDDGARL